MTAEELETVFALLLSAGTFEGETYWENEKNGMIAVYNGSQTETVAEVNATVPHLRFIYGEGDAALSDGTIPGFGFSGGEWGETFFCPDETYAGGGALGIRTSGSAYVSQSVKNVEAGKTYTFTAWLKTVRGSGAIKAEYSGDDLYLSGDICFYESADGKWTKAEYTFTVPEGVSSVSLLLRVVNGGEAYWDNLSLSDGETEIPLINSGFEESKGGVLTISIPPETLVIFGPINTALQGVEKNGILHTVPMIGGTVRCTDDTMAAQYITYNGKPELVRLYMNGDTVLDGDGEIRFFRWDDAMRPIEDTEGKKWMQ